MVPEQGFEPCPTESESNVLPIKLLRKNCWVSPNHTVWSQQRLQLNQALLRQCLDGRPKPVNSTRCVLLRQRNHHSTQPKHSPLTIIKNWLHHFSLYCGALFGLIRSHWSLGLFRLSCGFTQRIQFDAIQCIKTVQGQIVDSLYSSKPTSKPYWMSRSSLRIFWQFSVGGFSLFKGWLPLSPPPACYLVKELVWFVAVDRIFLLCDISFDLL